MSASFFTAVVHGAKASASASPLDAFRAAAEACGTADQWFGANTEEKAKIASWIAMDVSNVDLLVADMERVLQSSSFLALPARETAADLFIYSTVAKAAAAKELPANVSRWLAHMQGFVAASTGTTAALFRFKLEALRPVVSASEPAQLAPAAAAAPVKDKAAIAAAKKAEGLAAAAAKPAEKKEAAAAAKPAVAAEEEPKKKKAAAAATAAAPDAAKKPAAAPAAASGEFLPLLLDVKVGKILSCEKHKEADTLYVESIDLGEPTGPRQICSGLVKYYADASMLVGKTVLVVCNLKPRTMVGVESNGMVLACSNADKTKVELVVVPEGAQPGDKIQYAGYTGPVPEPMQPNQVNKKKILESVMPGWKTDANGHVNWTDAATGTVFEVQVQGKPCTGGEIKNGTVG